MVWKILGGNKDANKELNSPSSSVRSSTPGKSCLRGDSSRSSCESWTSSFSSPSQTYKCDSLSRPAHDTRSAGESSCNLSGIAPSSVAQECRSFDSKTSVGVRSSQHPNVQTVSTSASRQSSQNQKSVRFMAVEIRDYERIAGDNPSCSSGAPVSIGWSHLGSRTIGVDQYESSRPYRKSQLEMVLTRDERDRLLNEWDISTVDIVSSTRALLKSKNQRRQTVRNTNKSQRLEEGIESATRKLKRMLTLKRGTRSTSRDVEQNSSLVVSSRQSNEEQEAELDSEQRSAQRLANRPAKIMESDDDTWHNLEVRVAMADARKGAQGDSYDKTASTAFADNADAISCMSGFTLGNCTTASVFEMEKFYRELELEMFGDQELPSMVGQTLEVDVEIPEEDRVYYEPSPICGSQEPPSVVSVPIGGQDMTPTERGHVSGEEPYRSTPHQMQQPLPQHPMLHHHYQMQGAYNVHGMYDVHMQQNGDIVGQHVQLGSSLDSAGLGQPLSIKQHPHTIPKLDRSHQASDLPPARRNEGSKWGSGISYSRSSGHPPSDPSDGPPVVHIPLFNHLSPTNWMEGYDSRVGVRREWEPVTISEDAIEESSANYESEERNFMEQILFKRPPVVATPSSY